MAAFDIPENLAIEFEFDIAKLEYDVIIEKAEHMIEFEDDNKN